MTAVEEEAPSPDFVRYCIDRAVEQRLAVLIKDELSTLVQSRLAAMRLSDPNSPGFDAAVDNAIGVRITNEINTQLDRQLRVHLKSMLQEVLWRL